MAFKLTLYLEGLLSYVPATPLFVRKEGGPWEKGERPLAEITVLVPNLQPPGVARWKDQANKGVVRESHWPTLRCLNDHDRSAGPGIRAIDLQYLDQKDPTKIWNLFVLRREHLTFPQLSGGVEVADTIPTDQAQKRSSDSDARSLWWLPRIGEISPADRFASKALAPVPGQLLDRRLAGALTLRHGSLSVSEFNLESEGGPERVWEFTNPMEKARSLKPLWNRSIGYQLALALGEFSNPVRLQIAGGTAALQTSFVDIGGDEGEEVGVHLANLEPDELLLDRSLVDDRPLQDPDFDEVYRLSSRGSAGGAVPTRGGGHAGENKRPCTGGLFDGWG